MPIPLPPELISHSLTFLDNPGELYPLLLASHQLHELAKPLLYRHLNIPFIPHNRLTTLIRAVRRFPYLGEYTRTLTLGEDPFDNKRSVERVIGSVDINKLFPHLRKIELFAMTFERSMLYRFFAYCSRAEALEEVVLHYPDLVPLVKEIKGLRRLTWSVTSDVFSPVFRIEGGRGVRETEWIQERWVESLGKCCPNLEEVRVGTASRHARWGVNDRRDVETGESERVQVDWENLKLEKLKKVEWMVSEAEEPADVWKTAIGALLDVRGAHLEELKWAISTWGEDDVLLDRLENGQIRGLKKLDLRVAFENLEFAPEPPKISDNDDPDHYSGGDSEDDDIPLYRPIGKMPTRPKLAKALESWDPSGLQEFTIRFASIGFRNQSEITMLKALERAKSLKKLRMTWAYPALNLMDGGNITGYEWYFNDDEYEDEKYMEELLSNLPSSLEEVFINYDGKYDPVEGYQSYHFEQDARGPPIRDEELSSSIKDVLKQRKVLDKAILTKRMPHLREIYVGGYDFVDKSVDEVVDGVANVSV
ncbi:hypothetical protein ABW19_dt0205504 [Dactylella cylindrospora]|nr:hypothetical protein ABW19_dt0205504 [Dactylella cylindrospora]